MKNIDSILMLFPTLAMARGGDVFSLCGLRLAYLFLS
jgi:hypothetical protein